MNTGLNITEFRKKPLDIRLLILDAIYKSKKGHIGDSYSIVDILVSLFYGEILKFDPKNPDWENRDRFILSYYMNTILPIFPNAILKSIQ